MKLLKRGKSTLMGRMVLLTLCCLSTLCNLRAQTTQSTVSLSSKSITIHEAFRQIEAQTGMIVAVSLDNLDVSRTVTIARPSGSLGSVLDQVLAGTGMGYMESGVHIMIIPRKEQPVAATPTAADPKPAARPQGAAAVAGDTPLMPLGNVGGVYIYPPVITPLPRLGEPKNSEVRYPDIAIKSNLLTDLTATINVGVEVRTGNRTTLDVPFSINAWTWSENRKWKYFLVQPELRFWLCEPFNGSFIGLHAHYGIYNVGNLPSPPFSEYMKEHRFEGWLAGAGVSYGYHWILKRRWSMEATVGVGYAYLDYKTFKCEECGEQLSHNTRNYFGPTKLGVTLIYTIK